MHGHGAGPAIGQWDEQDGVRGAGDYPVHPDTAYALELAVRGPVPEWGGQCVRMALEQGIALTSDGVEYLDGRQTELILIPPADAPATGGHFLRASAVFLLLAFWMASTSCFFFIVERPEMSSFFASVSRWPLVALASTPPLVGRFVFRPPAACASEGPFRPPAFFSQWSPTFSKLCLTAAHATWLARFSSPYSSGGGVVRLGEGPLRLLRRPLQRAGQFRRLGAAALRGLRHDRSSRVVDRPYPGAAR